MKDKNKEMFIKTKDHETSVKLKEEGFHLVDYTNGVWTFLYDSERHITFDNDKVAYSNILRF